MRINFGKLVKTQFSKEKFLLVVSLITCLSDFAKLKNEKKN